ncbi:helix-turn-helix transcriptional regulator [Streptomyces sp. NPDC005708]|uniref:helix-turn-helix transcriptional regulator n=1 Tax=Streptomyces sp. NPDC005708 TaxID=3154564 RepID=UPI0033C7ABE0
MSLAPVLYAEAPAPAPAFACEPAPREREALQHIAAGRTYVQTARHMGLSKHTVDAYLAGSGPSSASPAPPSSRAWPSPWACDTACRTGRRSAVRPARPADCVWRPAAAAAH